MHRNLSKEWFELGGNPYDVINTQVVSQNFYMQHDKLWFVHNRKGNAYADGFFPNTQCLKINKQDNISGINTTPYLLGTRMQPIGDRIFLQSMYSDCWYLHFPPLNDWINSLLYSLGINDFSTRALAYYVISLFHLFLLYLLLRRYFPLNSSLMAIIFYTSSSLFIDWASMPLYIVWSEIFFTSLLLALPKNTLLSFSLLFAQVFTSINYILPQLAVSAVCKIRKSSHLHSLLLATVITIIGVGIIAINRLAFLNQSAASSHFAEVFMQREFLNWQQLLYSIPDIYFFFRMSLCTSPLLLTMIGVSIFAYFCDGNTHVKKSLHMVLITTAASTITIVVLTDTVMRHSWEYPRIFIIPLLLLFAFNINYLSQQKVKFILKLSFAVLLFFDIYSIRRFHYHESLLATKINLIQKSLDIIPSYALTIDGYQRPPLHDLRNVSNYGLIDRDFPIHNFKLDSYPFKLVPKLQSEFRTQLYFIEEIAFSNLVLVGSTHLREELNRCQIFLIDNMYRKRLIPFKLITTSQLKNIVLPKSISFHQFEAKESIPGKTQVVELTCDLRKEYQLYEIFTQKR